MRLGRSLVWYANYEPFGKAQLQAEQVVSNFGFPGQIQDAESGLAYNWHRHYSSALGRYIQPDPLGEVSDSNPFPYASNNPVSRSDPMGLQTACTKWVGAQNPVGSGGGIELHGFCRDAVQIELQGGCKCGESCVRDPGSPGLPAGLVKVHVDTRITVTSFAGPCPAGMKCATEWGLCCGKLLGGSRFFVAGGFTGHCEVGGFEAMARSRTACQ